MIKYENLTKIKIDIFFLELSGPSCSKLTTSLVNDSLKLTSSDTQIFRIFFAEKM